MKEDKFNYWALVFLLIIAGMLFSQSALAQDDWDRVLNLEGKWKFSIGDKEMWAATYYDDSKWEEIYVPSKWEDEGFNGYDGYAWYRKTFDGKLIQNRDVNFNLFLGHIDDVDVVFLNGRKIGSTGGFPPRYHTAYNTFRNYFIPKEYINFSGRNVIAVRVYDNEIEGGIVSGDVGIYTSKSDKDLAVNLRGIWSFKVTGNRNDQYNDINEKTVSALSLNGKDDWVEIMVPNAWENQGFGSYDGSAWYQKQFTIPKTLAGHDLVLLLGKIDDSDKTFLNGKLIGSTLNRHDHERIYYISASQVKSGEVNTLVVYADDTGGAGGIWEGPVGLMKQSEFTRYIRWK